MDRYDEKARSIILLGGLENADANERIIAQALRESAAEAFKESARHIASLEAPVSQQAIALYLMGRAAFLRSGAASGTEG